MGAYMKLKGIIDYDCTNYKEPTLTLEFPYCDFKCDKLNNCHVCQNSELAREPDIEISGPQIWKLYKENPLTKAFCFYNTVNASIPMVPYFFSLIFTSFP